MMDLKDELDTLCNEHGQSKLLQRINTIKSNHAIRFQADYGRFKDQFGVFFDLLNEILLGVNYIPHDSWPDYRGLQFIFITHNIQFIYSAFERLTCGLWEDCFVLSRPAYEAFIKTSFITLHPETAEAVILGKKIFNLTNYIKDELKFDWKDYYFYSLVTHSNKISVVKDWTSVAGKDLTDPIVIKLEYDKLEIEMGINLLLFLCVAYLKMATQLFATSNNESLPRSLVDRAIRLGKLWQMSMETHQGGYWPQVSRDINKLFEIIQLKEQSIFYNKTSPDQ